MQEKEQIKKIYFVVFAMQCFCTFTVLDPYPGSYLSTLIRMRL